MSRLLDLGKRVGDDAMGAADGECVHFGQVGCLVGPCAGRVSPPACGADATTKRFPHPVGTALTLCWYRAMLIVGVKQQTHDSPC